MTNDEVQQIIDDLDSAQLHFPEEGSTDWREGARIRRSLRLASNILVQIPDEVLATMTELEISTLK